MFDWITRCDCYGDLQAIIKFTTTSTEVGIDYMHLIGLVGRLPTAIIGASTFP